MKYRAVVKQSDSWWIGWLIDLPGVNAQEKTREDLIESLRIGAEEMLATQVPFEPQATMTLIDVPLIQWSTEDDAYIVSFPEFPGAHTHGDTYEEAVKNGEEVLQLMVTSYQQEGKRLPEPAGFRYAGI